MLSILIVDDEQPARDRLRRLVEALPGFEVTGEAASATAALDSIRQLEPDVLLLDISMPGISGLDVLKQIKNEKPKLPVLILSVYPEEQYAVRVLRAGAAGYLTKESALDELISAIRRIAQGRKYITSSLAERLATEVESDTDKPPHETLSDREYQVLLLIASGKAVKQIAEDLYLSEKTVSTYRSRILEKMRMKTNAELTYYTIKHNLLDQ